MGRVSGNGDTVLIRDDERVRDGDNGYTTMRTDLMPPNCTLKIVQMASFVLYIFHIT